MRECILQPGIDFDRLPWTERTILAPSDDVEKIVVLHNDYRYTAWFSKSRGVVEIIVGDILCYRFHISCALWFGIPKEDFEKQLRKKLSEIVDLVQLANYPSGYLSMCVHNKVKECGVGYTANNTYYGEDSKYPVDIYNIEWEDEEGTHCITK